MGDSSREPGAEECFVDWFDLIGEKPEGNLGGGGEVGRAQRQAARVENCDGVTGTGVFRAINVGSVDPNVTGRQTVGGAALNSEGRTGHLLLV